MHAHRVARSSAHRSDTDSNVPNSAAINRRVCMRGRARGREIGTLAASRASPKLWISVRDSSAYAPVLSRVYAPVGWLGELDGVKQSPELRGGYTP